jgi:hypothetical protein
MVPKRRALRLIPFLIGLLFAIMRLPPWLPKSVGMNLDQSWEWAAHEAWRLGLSHGRELVFTFGPFGFLQTETYVPSTYGLMLAIYAALTGLLVTALWKIACGATARGWLAALWLIVFIESMCIWDVSQSLFFHLSLALLVGHWRQGERPDRSWIAIEHSLAAGMALCSLVKFTCFTFAAAVMIGVAMDEAARRRRPPWIVATFGGSWLLLWMSASQPLSGITPFLRNSIEIATGFGRAMGVAGPRSEIVVYLMASLLLILFLLLMHWPKDRRWSVIPVGCLALILFLMFKIAFVRHDGHALTPAPLLLPWSFLFVALAWRPRASKAEKLAAICCLASTLTYTAVVVRNHLDADPWSLVANGVRGWPARIAAAGKALTGAEHLLREHESAAADIRRMVPLLSLSGTIDVYPFEGGIALAHGLSYRPRPALHSYSAYTPRLSRMDADHLRGPHAPECILFRVRPIDGRFPALDDSLSWPELLTRYEVRGGVASRFLLLGRSPRPRSYILTHIADLKGRTGEFVKLPSTAAGRAVWATIDLRPTWRGRAAAVIFKPPTVAMAVRQSGGRTRSYRVLPDLLRAGFILSPVIAGPADILNLIERSGSASLHEKRVEAIAIGGMGSSGIGWAYDADFDVKLWTLEIRER